MTTSTPQEIQQLWTKINKPIHHPAVLELVERYAADLLKWKTDGFNAEYSKLEQHLLKTIILPEDVPSYEELRQSSGSFLIYESRKLYTPPTKSGRILQDFVDKSRCYSDSVYEHFTRIGSWLSLLRDALWNMNQHIKRMRLQRDEERANAEKLKLKSIEESKAKEEHKAKMQLIEEENKARRRLVAIEREARILAKMEELRIKPHV